MAEPTYCKRCQTSIAPDTIHGLCPACLLEQGLGYSGVGETAAYPGRASGAGMGHFSALPDPAELTRLFPQLEVLELLGRGGMGVVYKARQRGLDRLVALKLLPPGIDRDPGFQERFVREARALARLCHPNVVAVYDFGQAGGQYYFLMEYVDGVNLRQMLAGGHMAPTQALAIVPQVCDALQFAHEEGIVHRDIKPENILVDKRGRVKIADFGLAKIITGTVPQTPYTLTNSNQVMGTPHYMAPEQFEKPAAVDHRADIFSLGVVFYEMLTGELPLGRFPPPSRKVQVDVRLDEVVLRTLEKEPQQRYQRAGEVKTELASLSMPPRIPTDPPPQYGQAATSFAGWNAAGGPGGGPPRRPAWGGGYPGGANPQPPVATEPRMSRGAVVAAVWALLFPCAFLCVSILDGPGPGPGIGLVVFLPIMLAGFVAPVGATGLGMFAIRRIRRSSGRLSGLGTALAAALFCPLLIMDGILGFGAFEAFDPHSTGDGFALLFLLTIVLGLMDLFIARRAWKRVKGPPNLPPAPRYQLRPRPSRFVRLVKALIIFLFVGGMLFVLAVVIPRMRFGMPAATPASAPFIQAQPTGDEQTGSHNYRFQISSPRNRVATFWVEYWRDGKLVPIPKFNSTQWVVPSAHEPLYGSVEFGLGSQVTQGLPTGEGKAQPGEGQQAITLKLNANGVETSSSAWIDDPFKDMTVRDATTPSWSTTWHPDLEKNYTLAVLRGGRERLPGVAGEAKAGERADVEIRLMARFDPIPHGQAAEGPKFGSSANPPPAATQPAGRRVRKTSRASVTDGAAQLEASEDRLPPAPPAAPAPPTPPAAPKPLTTGIDRNSVSVPARPDDTAEGDPPAQDPQDTAPDSNPQP